MFIIVSDIGTPAMHDLMLQVDPEDFEENAVLHVFGGLLKAGLERHWKDLTIAPLVHKFVPFLPFGPAAVAAIVRQKLQAWAYQPSPFWKSVVPSNDLPAFLSGAAFVNYVSVSDDASAVSLQFSRYGARDVHVSHHGPIERLKKVLYDVFATRGRGAEAGIDAKGDASSSGAHKGGSADTRPNSGRAFVHVSPDPSAESWTAVIVRECTYRAIPLPAEADVVPHDLGGCEEVWRGVL